MVALKFLLLASAGLIVSGRFLAPPAVPKEALRAVEAPNGDLIKVAAPKEAAKLVSVQPHNATKNANVAHKKHNMTEEEQIAKLQEGLQTIQKLQSVFTAGGDQQASIGAEMASGAMTSELSKKDSAVWQTISSMLAASKSIAGKMKGAKTEADRKKIMGGLEDELNHKAETLTNMTDKATETNEKHSAEYLLGLLSQHQTSWDMQQQLNVTLKFANSSIAALDLSLHHDMTKPFAPQLAAIMDNEKKALATATAKAKNATKANNATKAAATVAKAPVVIAKVPVVAKEPAIAAPKASASVAAKKAAKQFIQLVASLREMKA